MKAIHRKHAPEILMWQDFSTGGGWRVMAERWWVRVAGILIRIILLHEKFLQFDWLRAVVFQLNLKYLHVKITNLLRVVV